MTKKDYIKFARMFAEFRAENHIIADNALELLEQRTADIFSDDNDRFDRDNGQHADGRWRHRA